MSDELSPTRGMVSVALLFECALGVLAIVVGWFVARWPLEQFAWTARAAGYGLVATTPLVMLLLFATRCPIGPLKELGELVREMVGPLFSGATIWELLAISVAAGWGEELLFRGLLQPLAADSSGQAWIGLLIASIVFGLAHPITPTYVVVAALIGAYLGWLLIVTGNLLVPMVAHAAYDFVALVYYLRIADRSSGQSPDELLRGVSDEPERL